MIKCDFYRLTSIFAIFFLVVKINNAQSQEFGERVDKGAPAFPEIREASGLAASRQNPGVLWTHNDSDDRDANGVSQTRIFAMSTEGKHLGVYHIEGISNRDWEDIAVGPGPEQGKQYIYVGEIGDNLAEFPEKFVYRIPEPAVKLTQNGLDTVLTQVDIIKIQYPDGIRDAEALFVDPLTKDIYVISKSEAQVMVYRAAYPQSTTELITLEHVATLNMTGVVAADISPNGEEILVKTFELFNKSNEKIYYWKRSPQQSIAAVFATNPGTVPYAAEIQGEAVCWDGDGLGYFTLSEESIFQITPHLYYYPRLNTTEVIDNTRLPESIQLLQNYPNPFNPSTTIRYSIPSAAFVKIAILDALGREIIRLVNGHKPAGTYDITFNANELTSGVYFYKLDISGLASQSQVKKMLIVR